jgi:hypothetical protein
MQSTYQVVFKNNYSGTITTPFTHTIFNRTETIEISFRELSQGIFSFAKYNVIQFIINADNVEDAITLAKNRADKGKRALENQKS